MKNIYDMLNDVQVDLDELEKEGFNDIEKQRIKRKFRKSIKKKKNYNKYIAIASVAVISLGVFSTTSIGAYANDRILEVVYGIKEVLGIKGDLENYTTNINQTVTKNGLTVKINEVLLDRDELIIYMTKTYKEELKEGEYIDLASDHLSINGKRVSEGAKGYYTKRNKYSEDFIIGYKLNKDDYEGDINVKLSIYEAYIDNFNEKENENEKENKIKGPWKFKFKVNGDELKKKTKVIEVDDDINLTTGSTLQIDKYRSNVLRSEIYGRVKVSDKMRKKDKDYGWIYSGVRLKGKDDLGNEIEFQSLDGYFDVEEGKYYNSIWTPIDPNNINKNTKKLYLTPYLNEGDGEYKKIGEEFVIEIK